MKIVHLVAGAGSMYCGSCMQGNTLCCALGEAGEDVLLAPVYTPIRTDEASVSVGRVAMGGVNVFLQQSAAGRSVPKFVSRLLDSPALLGRLGGSTRPERLGPLTVSMLRGEQGNQQKEIEKLVAWLAADAQPDLVHFSTALLVGAARTIAERLGVPVIATLSGEDSFVEQLPEPYRTEAREEMRVRCGELAAMVAPSAYYAEFMADYLMIPSERITVIRPGLNLQGHAPPRQAAAAGEVAPAGEGDAITIEPQQAVHPRHVVQIGYLSRICPAKGLHQLVEAFRILLRDPTLPPLRLVAAGYLGRGDRPYFRQIRRQLRNRGLREWFEYRGELDRAEKIAFLRSVDVLCIPATRPESRGLVALEGLANGTPVVLPQHGVFSELIAETGGGTLYEPNRPTALAAALERLVRDPEMARSRGRRAQEVIHREYDARRAAERLMELYRTVCRG